MDQYVAPTIAAALAGYTVCDQYLFYNNNSIGNDNESRWWTITLFITAAFVVLMSRIQSRSDGVGWCFLISIATFVMYAAYYYGYASARLPILYAITIVPAIIISVLAAIDTAALRRWDINNVSRWSMVSYKRVDLYVLALAWWSTFTDFHTVDYYFGDVYSIGIGALLFDGVVLIVASRTSIPRLHALLGAISCTGSVFAVLYLISSDWSDAARLRQQVAWISLIVLRIIPVATYIAIFVSHYLISASVHAFNLPTDFYCYLC
jgi:membrane-associated HD superfamily phosphohydrolase